MTAATVQVVDLHVWHAQAHVLNGLNLHAMPQEVVVLLGRRGSGRRAALRAIGGQFDTREGSVRIIGHETIRDGVHSVAHQGLGLLPAWRSVLPHLTCEENLLLPATSPTSLGGGMSLQQIYGLCPDLNRLSQTLAASLSQAEQRLLAIAQILRSGATVLLMDHIADGLSPIMQHALSHVIVGLRSLGYTIIMAEANTTFCAPLADRYYLMDGGRVIDDFDRQDLPLREQSLHAFLTHQADVVWPTEPSPK